MSGIALDIGPEAGLAEGAVEAMARRGDCMRWRQPGFGACVIVDPARDHGISAHDGAVIVFDGAMVEPALRGDALRRRLAEDVAGSGAAAALGWRGSYRLAIHRDGTTWIFADDVGSRPLFHAAIGALRCWSSSATDLAGVLPSRTLDGANLLQFMAAGRFFAGGSPFEEIRQAMPGTCHRIDAGGERIETWFRHAIAAQADARDPRLLRDELKRLCDEAILSHHRAARAPSLMLSGGYDSRFLLNTLDAHLGRGHGVDTWLWCERDDDPGSDLAWAKREAARLDVAFHHWPAQGRVVERFDAMFDAQSGMTEQIFTHTDERAASAWMAHARGRRGLLRADECFGPNGGPMRSREAALAKVGVPAIGRAQARDWFGARGDDWREARDAHVAALAACADHPDDLRDSLYCRERLPALQAHLHAHRRPWLETSNPFLDRRILEFVASLPAGLRTDKRLFRDCFHHSYPTTGFATKPGTGFEWSRLFEPASPTRPRLPDFLLDRLRALPAPFDRDRFVALAEHALASRLLADPHDPAAAPPLKLAARAVILGHWLQRWPATS